MKAPDEITLSGVRLKRLVGTWEPSRYRATVIASGNVYDVRGGYSKRFPWRAFEPGESLWLVRSSTLAGLAEDIALYDRALMLQRATREREQLNML